MSRKLTTEIFIERAKALHGDRFSYEKSVYSDMDSELIVSCMIHGDFSITPRNHLRGKGGCNKCTGGVALTQEEFISKCMEKHKGFYDYSKVVYKNHHSEITIICPEHGEFTQIADYHGNGNGCQKCAGRVVHTKESFLAALPEKHKQNTNYDYSKIPNEFSPTTKLTIVCKEHGEFTTDYHRFVVLGNACRSCSGHAKKSTYEFVELATLAHKGLYTYDNVEYVDARTEVMITCKVHGDFPQTPDNHVGKQKGCPHCNCSYQVSSQEDRLHETFPTFSKTNRNVIAPYHLDLYSEEHALAIEVNGRYWHSEAKGKSQDYHLTKTRMCQDKGIRLLHFWDDEVNKKFNIIESMIKSRIGGTTKLYARKTEVRVVDNSEAGRFLERNHLQGSANSSKSYGLFVGEELISVMSLGQPRFDTTHEWEILRFATKLNTTVVGGASKLFKAFVLDENPNSVITYADRRYSEGKVYETLGFVFSHDSKPSYFYHNGNKNISRYSAQKHKLPKLLGDKFDPTKSEHQNMLDAGFVRVYDCGNKVFTWRTPNALHLQLCLPEPRL